ncbi:UTP--glucose-1-phosphate uridylyltransferase [Desulfonauticus submarinus]|uniref:UTP--glucose-1-phosphate uridylyltransferase n=1 Tax=Desulfonauticus submarinus TaxID=206665 RepID=A0A1H0CKS1_9BACT|nr:UTP--glucose-1-phosphate uridylyltransferase [Desulfonauticus submarinus]SDN58459.1 UTP--glucose-1-phosphate uridylyltransferase [Desulfonauticus submarinus]
MTSSIDCITNTDTELLSYFKPFALKMESQGIPPIVINLFKCYFSQLLFGSQGKLTKKEILPLKKDELKTLKQVSKYTSVGKKVLKKLVVFKLNGGLGTTMGLKKPKGLIPVKNNKNFLELSIEQIEILRSKHKQNIPLIFMNSFYTHEATMKFLEKNLNTEGIPSSFVQNKFPRIFKKDLSPAKWSNDPQLEWNPPGHGDFYTALFTTRLLDILLDKGYQYAFISNCDNLGAKLDLGILGYLAKEELSFIMEVTERTHVDKKGGHLCRLLKNYRLALRELAQCPSNELSEFQNIKLYSFFNTNSLWLDLKQIKKIFLRHKLMPLDLIINEKHIDSADSSSPLVYQLETAIGSAISAFDFAEAINVPRNRFSPVKTTSDLLLIRSNCYNLDQDKNITLRNTQDCLPKIILDPKFYKNLHDFEKRFPYPVKIQNCSQIEIYGNIFFGKNIIFKDKVKIINKTDKEIYIEDKTISSELIIEN